MKNLIIRTNKKFGRGSFSLIISLFSICFSFTYISNENREKSIGDIILNSIGIYNMTIIISILLFIISIFIGNKYKQHFGAKLGMKLSIFFIILIITLGTINFIRFHV